MKTKIMKIKEEMFHKLFQSDEQFSIKDTMDMIFAIMLSMQDEIKKAKDSVTKREMIKFVQSLCDNLVINIYYNIYGKDELFSSLPIANEEKTGVC